MKSFIIRVQLQTLEQLEKEYNCPKNKIISLNNIKENIYEGQWLYIESYKGQWYTVCPFDTLETICLKFNIDKSEMMNINEIDAVFIGQRIFIKNGD